MSRSSYISIMELRLLMTCEDEVVVYKLYIIVKGNIHQLYIPCIKLSRRIMGSVYPIISTKLKSDCKPVVEDGK